MGTTRQPGGIVACHDTNSEWPHVADIVAQGVQLHGGRGLTMWQRK